MKAPMQIAAMRRVLASAPCKKEMSSGEGGVTSGGEPTNSVSKLASAARSVSIAMPNELLIRPPVADRAWTSYMGSLRIWFAVSNTESGAKLITAKPCGTRRPTRRMANSSQTCGNPRSHRLTMVKSYHQARLSSIGAQRKFQEQLSRCLKSDQRQRIPEYRLRVAGRNDRSEHI